MKQQRQATERRQEAVFEKGKKGLGGGERWRGVKQIRLVPKKMAGG